MLDLTRQSTRTSRLGDWVDVVSINGTPLCTIRDAWKILILVIVRLRPAIGGRAPGLKAGFEDSILTIRESTGPAKRTARRQTGVNLRRINKNRTRTGRLHKLIDCCDLRL